MRLSVVVPVLNEAETVATLVAEIDEALKELASFEILFVDDGSTDATRQRLRDAAERCPRLRVLRHARRAGQSAGINTGVMAARGTIIATLDGDGQNDPADILRLMEIFVQEGDDASVMVTGLRRDRRDTLIKRVTSRIANGVRRRLLHDDTVDTGCGLKVFAREAFLAMPRFDHMHRFLPALMARQGGRIISVPVNHRPRAGGRSKYGTFDRLWVGIVDLLGVMWLRRRANLCAVRREP